MMTMDAGQPPDIDADAGKGVAFLLSQLGFYVSGRYRQRVEALGLEPRHVGVLYALGAREGQSQQTIGEALGIPPSRMVAVIDDLEEHGLVERRRNPADRRAYAVHLTTTGRNRLEEALLLSAAHEEEIAGALDPDDRRLLVSLLERVADAAELRRGVHPGLGAGPGKPWSAPPAD